MSRRPAFSIVRRLSAVVAAGAAITVLANMAVFAVALVPLVDDQLEDRVRQADLAMHRVLANLIDNALAHGAGPVELLARQDAGELRVLVRDAGPGIAAQDLAAAIGPFGRLAACAARPGSSGLGLAIVDQVAQQLGGRVVVEPFDGRASAVGIAVPLHNPAVLTTSA